MSKGSIKARLFLQRSRMYRLETGFSMLEAVVVVGVLLALAVSGFLAYGPITQNAKIAKVKSAASEIHTGVLVASTDGDPNTKPDDVIGAWNASTDKIKVEILEPAAGGASANGDYCVSATNLETPSITARAGSCTSAAGGSIADMDNDGIPNGSDPDIDGDGTPNGDDTTPNGPIAGGGGGGYTADGIVPAGYTYGANTGACPAPFAEALRARIIANGSQEKFAYNVLPWGDPTQDAVSDAYYAVDAIASDLYSAMTSSQQATLSNFSNYTSDVPGYDDAEDAFWSSYAQRDYNRMNELAAQAVPAFCGAVTAGTGTQQCHPETQIYLTQSNAFYHNYMYENQRYTVDPTTANETAWTQASAAYSAGTQIHIDGPAKDAAYDAMVAAVGGDWEVTFAQNMKRQELNDSLANFQADTSRANFDIWVNYEYPINACR